MGSRADRELAEIRSAFERELELVKGALGSELGRRPSRAGWILALVSAAAGLAVAWRVRSFHDARVAERGRLEEGGGGS